jgi:putative spermidine/putrescine transport system permease protein
MRPRQRWLRLRNRAPSWCLTTTVTLLYVFILLPIFITASVSFNERNRSSFPPEGFSLRWWEEALSPDWVDPLVFSLKLATYAAVLSTAVGLPLAFALHRYRFPGRDALVTLSMAPLLLPALITGIGLLQMFHFMGLRDWIGMPSLVIGHIVISIPYVVRTVSISLHAMPASVEQAAMNLGANHRVVFLEITLPLVKSGVFAGVVFTFIHSFNDVPLSLFISSPGAKPIPIAILNFMDYGFAPTLAAVAVITVLIPLVLIVVAERLVGIGDFVYRNRDSD